MWSSSISWGCKLPLTYRGFVAIPPTVIINGGGAIGMPQPVPSIQAKIEGVKITALRKPNRQVVPLSPSAPLTCLNT
jgi:hypothetical protein